MAFLPDDPNTQNQNQAPAGQNGSMASQAPITSSPAPAGGGTSGKTINQASSSAPAQPFTNLQTYLTANAPQIQQQGQQIAGTLNDQYGAATGAIDQSKNTFNSQVDAGYTHNDPQVVDNFSADPSAVAGDPNAAKQFTGMYNDQYTGPASFESSAPYGAVNDQVNKGVSLAKQVSTPGGVQSYLMGQNPNETQGMATLDSSLIGANPDAVSTVTNAAARYNDLPSYLTNAVTSADSGVTAAQQQAQAAQQAAQAAASKYSTDFSGRVNSAYDTAAKSSVDYNNQMNDIITKMNAGNYTALTPEEQKLVGFNPDIMPLINNYASIFPTQAAAHPLDSSNYFTPGDNAAMPTPAGVMSDKDISEAKALQQLTGQGPALNFDLPGAHVDGAAGTGIPGKLPAFNNEAPLSQISQSYQSMYQQLLAAGKAPQTAQDYMNQLFKVAGTPQPGSTPTTPQPAPGSPGDLGAGFHWDTSTGSWQPTIPLQPTNPPPSSGGGLAAR